MKTIFAQWAIPFCLVLTLLLGACGEKKEETGDSGEANNGDTGNTTPSSVSSLMGGAIQGSPLSLSTEVSTFAGGSGDGDSTDGTGTSATFYAPIGITTDGTNLFVADYYTIRKIVIASGEVTTLAGSGEEGSADATGTSATFNRPTGITTDGTNLYVAERSNHTIRKIVIATGVVTTLAGTAGTSGSNDATGTSATFNRPRGITTDGTNLYVAESENHKIRKIVIATGVVTTLAGSGSQGMDDGTGTSASFSNPQRVITDGTNLYVTDEEDKGRISKIQ